jgi:hypothetical protein
MRRRERAFALVLGTICALSLLGGAWPLPLIACALLELGYTAVEHAAALHARREEGTRELLRRARRELAGGILRGTP